MTTIQDGDVIIVDKITSQFRDYRRWDVVVFVPPGQENAFIKRIVWLPGETIKIHEWEVYVCLTAEQEITSCEKLPESYLSDGSVTGLPCGNKGKDTLTVDQEDSYLVFGDNRPWSTDSRCCFLGHWCSEDAPYLAPKDHILWRAALRILPIGNIGTF